MSEVGTKEWKVLDFRPGKTEPNPHGGQFQKFYVDFEGSPDTYWRRREGDEPEVGRSYFGTITEGNYGPMFKKEKAPDGSTSSGGSKNYGGKSKEWQSEQERDPERSARILRQHSQEMALRLATHNALGEAIPAEEVFEIANVFDQDVITTGQKAAQKAGGGGNGNDPKTTSLSSVTPGQAQEKQSTAEYLTKLLEDAGVNDRAAGYIRDYALQEMSPEEQDAACDRLANENTRAAAVTRLTERTEAALGEPLPVVAPAADEEIPF